MSRFRIAAASVFFLTTALSCTKQGGTDAEEPTAEEPGVGGSEGAGKDQTARDAIEERTWLESDCPWPADGRAALSLTYDDGMSTQLSKAAPALREANLRATFFPNKVNNDQPWKDLLSEGHELGAHTQFHPCPAAYGTPSDPLETYSLESMAEDLDADVAQLRRLGAREPFSFAYPCGVTWVGEEHDSYAALVNERFAAARMAGPASTTPEVDLQAIPANFSLKTAEQFIAQVDRTVERGEWLVLGFHGIGGQWSITDEEAHAALVKNLSERSDIWIAPLGEVAACVAE